MTKIVNLTPHAVNFCVDGNVLTIPASGQLARVSVQTVPTGEVINGIPVMSSVYGNVEGLPAPQDGVVFLVSTLVAGRVTDRNDVFVPNDFVRDDQGRITGCRSLGRI